jgi:hypothetical protein
MRWSFRRKYLSWTLLVSDKVFHFSVTIDLDGYIFNSLILDFD